MEKQAKSTYGQACKQCAKAKARCVARPEGACERCSRLKRACQPSEPVRQRGQQTHEISAQIERLEGRIEILTSVLHSIVGSGVSVDLPSLPLDELLGVTSPHSGTASSSENAGIVTGSGPPLLPNSEPSACPSPPDLPPLEASSPLLRPPYEPAPEEAEHHLSIFRSRMLPRFPFIHICSDLTASSLRHTRPFLFRAVIAVATPSTQLKVARIEELKGMLAKSTLDHNVSAVDMLLSILTYITWSSDPFMKQTSSLSRMMMMAVSLAYELQLAGPSSLEAQVITKMAPGFGEADQDGSETASGRCLERQRAVLACFVLSSYISSYFRRIEAMRWTSQMEEGLRIIEASDKTSSAGEAFVFQVRVQLLAHKVAQVREQQSATGQATVTTTSAPVSLYLKVLQGQLRELQASRSPDLQLSDMLTASTHYLDLCINEVTRPATSTAPIMATSESYSSFNDSSSGFETVESLWRCFHAAKNWLDCFHNVSPREYMGFPFFYWFQLIRCLIILKHLSTFEDPAWDRSVVCSTIDLHFALGWMADKAERASKESGEFSDDDTFRQVSKMLRMSQEWINSKRSSEAQATGGSASISSDGNPSRMDDLSPAPWMDAFQSGDDSWIEEYFDWCPGTL